MDLDEAIKNRRSIRRYKALDIAEHELRELVESAHWAPSAGNINPRHFLAIKNPRAIESIKSLSPGMFGNPAAIIAICADRKKAEEKASSNGYIYSVLDVAMAAQNLLLAAYARGIGSCVIRSFHAQAIGELLELPEHIVPELLVALGYPEGDSPRGIRPALKGIYHLEHYGGSTANDS